MDRSPSSDAPAAAAGTQPLWLRVIWLLGGVLSLALGIVGIFLPLLPTTPFVLLAAFCFARGSSRCERWLLQHRTFGPMVRDWRANRAVPLRAKQLASVMMALGSVVAAFKLPLIWAWLPAACCACVAVWLWSLPTRAPSN
ncbi:YbaN family protein [Paucibacter sp. B51]|uniref:YbaN family protein n=1 Tax=Paucibacter sp. B51 TaxID=2993315 RepID=UPI0022EC0371|nr:YbaN family protein [Paucibacter sp. B51]